MSIRRVLIIEDSLDMLDMLSNMFQIRLQCVVETASTVDQAEALLRLHKFNLIVSDFEMPVRGGPDVVRFLEKEQIIVPLLFYTGHELHSQVMALMNYPYASVLKPNHEKLIELAREILSFK